MNSILVKYEESKNYRFFDFDSGRWITDQLSRSAAINHLVVVQDLTKKRAKQVLDSFDFRSICCEPLVMPMPQSFMPSVRKDSSL